MRVFLGHPVEDNKMLSSLAISRMTNLEEIAVRRNLYRDLGKLSLCCIWVAHSLTNVNKQRRVECCQEMQIVLSRRNANHKTIVIDEKWVYLVDVATKENIRIWVNSASDRSMVPKRTISSKNVLVIVASNFNKSLYYTEILHDGGTVNAERYLTFLQNMIEHFDENYQLERRQFNMIMLAHMPQY